MPMDTSGTLVSHTNTVHLPIEIVDEILLHLRTDNPSLRNCALVCKSWTPGCRRHIFFRVGFKDFLAYARWCESFSTALNGPHRHVRELEVNYCLFAESEPDVSSDVSPPFLQHFALLSNVQVLLIEGSAYNLILENISFPDVFGHLSATLRSLSIRNACCPPRRLISFVAFFRHLNFLELTWVWFDTSESHNPIPERRTFEGTFSLTDWDDSSEEFVRLLTEHDLQYSEIYVSGEHWLRDSTWNRCLVNCADNLETFAMAWFENRNMPAVRTYDTLTFKNLRELLLQSSSVSTTILPPPEFLSSITSNRLSRIMIGIAIFRPGEKFDRALDAVGDYDEALCKLSSQLKSSSKTEKLVLTLRIPGGSFVPDAILARFRKVGVVLVMEADA